MFIQLHEQIVDYLLKPRICSSHSIQVQLNLLFHYSFWRQVRTVNETSHGVSQPSMSMCIVVVTDALCSIAKDYIQFPNLLEQSHMQQSCLEKCGFPLVLGSIDCSPVAVVAPSNIEEIFVNQKINTP